MDYELTLAPWIIGALATLIPAATALATRLQTDAGRKRIVGVALAALLAVAGGVLDGQGVVSLETLALFGVALVARLLPTIVPQIEAIVGDKTRNLGI